MPDSSAAEIPEKLGSFYLGSTYDLATGAVAGPQLHYDARDLTTHAVCVGMTGSGKTGLCVGLLEEAAIDRIPALIIDPKGDMGNLLLHFPELRPDDFRPWINEDDARRKNMSADEFASSTSQLWRKGLSEWGIGPSRIRALNQSVEYTVYTPGSESVRPINILGSLRSPKDGDAETIRESVAGTVGALLGLVGIDADPVKSQEAIFLSVLLEHFWTNGQDIDLGTLVRSIQDPPVRKFGVFDIDSFLPEGERFRLAMALNNLMASPSFAAWMTGAPLDVDALLYRADGTPRHSIFYIAHLSDPERMFLVTLLLNAVVAWMRKQPGTTSLRALLYFDEVFGFLPPVAVPPSKRPLLTLLKQARAFGVGTVLVTQNPVDLDYKALSNAGTWFIGRLQSKQDQQRLLEGLKTASATTSASESTLAQSIGQLRSRVFVMNNVHDNGPTTFHARWAMNYLRGPLTRTQLRAFVDNPAEASGAAVSDQSHPASRSSAALSPSTARPALPPGLSERFLDVNEPSGTFSPDELMYRSTIGAIATTHFVDRKHDVAAKEVTLHLLLPPLSKPAFNWSDAVTAVVDGMQIADEPLRGIRSFAGGLPQGCNTKNDAADLGKDLKDWLYHNRRLSLLYNETLEVLQRAGESIEAFRGRMELAAREKRDQEIDDAAEKFQQKLERLESKHETVLRSIAEQEDRYEARKHEELLSLGETVLGIVLGRRRRLTTVATKRRMTSGARAKLETLAAKDEELRDQMQELSEEARDETERITRDWDEVIRKVVPYEISPRRNDVTVDFVGVLWLPYHLDSGADSELPAYRLNSAPS